MVTSGLVLNSVKGTEVFSRGQHILPQEIRANADTLELEPSRTKTNLGTKPWNAYYILKLFG